MPKHGGGGHKITTPNRPDRKKGRSCPPSPLG
nr:MAG TPA: hypothetical protein [Caudoviricetes sp.]